MRRLASRDKQIPFGFKFFQPETGWRPRPFSSFNEIVDELIRHRLSNPDMVRRYGWKTARAEVELEVEEYNVNICIAHQWNDYLMPIPKTQELPSPPPPPPPTTPEPLAIAPEKPPEEPAPKAQPPRDQFGRVVAGAEVLIDWLSSGAEAVDANLAERRAAICASCPHNGKGDLSRWFTIPVSEAIRHALSLRKQYQLSTSRDDELGVCEQCGCPLKLKIHLPINQIIMKIDRETKRSLPVYCWISKLE